MTIDFSSQSGAYDLSAMAAPVTNQKLHLGHWSLVVITTGSGISKVLDWGNPHP